MTQRVDITKQRFGRLVALKEAGRTKTSRVTWKCRCDCGSQIIADGVRLRRGNIQSCGCLTPKIDLLGQRFGRLTVIKDVGRSSEGTVLWRCQCDCGTKITVRSSALKSNHTNSCGCLHREIASRQNLKHGHGRDDRNTGTYRSWMAMNARCRNPNSTHYEYYGGCGVTICEHWREYGNFLADLGERPEGLTLDRIKSEGNYEPGNCRWVTRKEQAQNRRKKYKKRKLGQLRTTSD